MIADLRLRSASIEAAAMFRWAMSSMGKVRQHLDQRWYVDFGHGRRIWTLRVGDEAKLALTEDLAHRVLELVRGQLSEGKPLDEALAQFQPSHAKPNLVQIRLDRWLEVKVREVRAGDRSPTYLAELERYAKDGGHFSWWDGRSIHEVSFAALEDWSHWLADRGLGPKTRHNVLAAFHSFLGWLYKRNEIRELPRDFPWPKLTESEPAVLSMEAQRAILAAIVDEGRGVFLALSLLGLRPSEAVALRTSDCRDGWITIARARKGARLSAPEGSTKTGAARRLPIPQELQVWIETHVTYGVAARKDVPKARHPLARLEVAERHDARVPAPMAQRAGGGSESSEPESSPVYPFPNPRRPLFVNPRTGGPWAKGALRRTWATACTKVGVRISLYNGTKHTMATDAIARGVPERSLQAMLGHSSAKSTRRYARLSDQALIEVLPRRKG